MLEGISNNNEKERVYKAEREVEKLFYCNRCDVQVQRGGFRPTMKLNLSLLVTLLMADTVWSQCRTANWWKSFDRKGWSNCGSTTEYLTGFYRNNKRNDDPIYLLEEGKCCKAPAPNENQASTCKNANWWGVLDRLVTL